MDRPRDNTQEEQVVRTETALHATYLHELETTSISLNAIVNTYGAAINTDTDAETDVLRRLLLFTVSADYKCSLGIKLSQAERQHFKSMYKRLRQISKPQIGVIPTQTEYRELASSFRQHIHAPCRALGLPVECAVAAIERLVEHTNRMGVYTGSIAVVFDNEGAVGLAAKVFMDRQILRTYRFPVIKEAHRKRLHTKIRAVERQHFEQLAAETHCTNVTVFENGWRLSQGVHYILNERGRAQETIRSEKTRRRWVIPLRDCLSSIKGWKKASSPRGPPLGTRVGSDNGPGDDMILNAVYMGGMFQPLVLS